MSVVTTDPTTSPESQSRMSAGRRELWLVWIALGVIALHIIDDSFLQPQPGTSPGDHLVGGLVPLALIVGLGVGYARWRPGVRAAVAGLLGIMGITVGAEAVYYLSQGEGSGDDYTGVLAIAAGLTLIGCALTVLWRSRRVDDRRWWRYTRRSLVGVAAAVVAYVAVMPLGMSYVFTHVGVTDLAEPDLGAPYEDVEMTTSDGLTVQGWYVPSRNGAAVIVVPGLSNSQDDEARMLVDHGYGVLVLIRRGEGESEGDPNMFGWAAPKDVHAAVDFLSDRPEVDPNRIGGIGFSVGGEILIQAAAESDQLAAIVSEGGSMRSLRETLNLSGWSKWMGVPSTAILTGGVAVFGNEEPPPNLEDLAVEISPQAVFLVYAADGQLGEVELTDDYYAAASEPKEIWEVPDGGHIGGYATYPQEYEQRVVAFFDAELLG
ncbi:MAG TPA: CocE/NonD family hydrolase [Nocardioidaceae bacterium]|nr:CocE/NonD family hydrolase [Nocardioidaceae bacterium]